MISAVFCLKVDRNWAFLVKGKEKAEYHIGSKKMFPHNQVLINKLFRDMSGTYM